MLEYRGFKANFQYCANLQIYVAEVVNMDDRIVFGACQLRELDARLIEAVEQYLSYRKWRAHIMGEAIAPLTLIEQ